MKKVVINASVEKVEKLLSELRLPSAAARFKEMLSEPASASLPTVEFIEGMLQSELISRQVRRVERLLKESGLRRNPEFLTATAENVLYTEERGLTRNVVERLVSCDWIRQPAPPSVIITGASGTGKTWLVHLIGRCACEQSLPVLYVRFPELLERLQDALDHHESASYRRTLNLKKLLIIDDFGIGKVTPDLISEVLSLIEARCHVSPTLIAGQLDPSEWYEYLGRSHGTDALVDRLLNYSYNVKLTGASLRERERPKL